MPEVKTACVVKRLGIRRETFQRKWGADRHLYWAEDGAVYYLPDRERAGAGYRYSMFPVVDLSRPRRPGEWDSARLDSGGVLVTAPLLLPPCIGELYWESGIPVYLDERLF
jgi:hypothetical protein